MTQSTLLSDAGRESAQVKQPGQAAEKSKKADEKILLLAVQKHDGKIVITPIDIEHEGDDQSPLTPEQKAARKNHDAAFCVGQIKFDEALGHLYDMFAGRLYREKFSSFQDHCFALYGTNRIPDEKQEQAKAKVRRWKASNQQRKEVSV